MNTEELILRKIFELLNKSSNYAVLRNFQDIPQKRSRDIDIIIKRNDFFEIRNSLISTLYTYGYQILMYYKGGEMHSMIFASCKKEESHLVSFDFSFSIYVRDMVFFTADQILKSRQYNGILYHVRKDWEYLAKYTYNTILGVPYPNKYLDVKKEAESLYSEEIRTQLYSIGIRSTDKNNNFAIRFLLLKKHFWISLIAFFRYLYYSLYNALHSQGISIGFTGPDGSGKTTVINQLIKELNIVLNGIVVFHFRPSLYGNLGDVAYSVGVKKTVDHNFNMPHRGEKTGIISSCIRLLYYSMDYLLGGFLKLKPLLFKRNVIVFDRYYTDIICDSRRSRIYLPLKFLYWWGRYFIPSLDYNILLTAQTDTILGRKKELDREGIEAINARIDYLASKPSFYKVLNEGTPQEAVAEILRIVFEKQHKKNMERLSL